MILTSTLITYIIGSVLNFSLTDLVILESNISPIFCSEVFVPNCRKPDRLHFFVKENNLAKVKNILKDVVARDVDINFADKKQRTVLHHASKRGYTQIVEVLLQQPDILIDPVDNLGNTPLHLAAARGNCEIVEMLIDKKANLNVQNKNGESPFFRAVNNGREKVVENLIKLHFNELDFNMQDKYGRTPLNVTVSGCNTTDPYIMRLLLESGRIEDINNQNCEGNTIISDVAGGISLEKLKLLISYGADINKTNFIGESPLHRAAFFCSSNAGLDAMERNYKKLSIILTQPNIIVNVKNSDGQTPLHYALKNRAPDIKIIELLLQYGADPTIKDKKGKTPADITDDLKIKELLKKHCNKEK